MLMLYFSAALGFGEWLSRSRQQQFALLMFLLVSMVVSWLYAVVTFYTYVFALTDGVVDLKLFLPWGFVNIRYWSQIASWLIPVMPLAIVWRRVHWRSHRLWRLGVYFTAACWWWLLFMSMARGSLLSLGCSAVLIMCLVGGKAWPWCRILICQMLFGVFLWVLMTWVPGYLIDNLRIESFDTSSSGRLVLWREALAMSVENFPLGMGPNSWLLHEPLTEEFNPLRRLGHPHNMYLFWAAEYGWLLICGLVAILGCISGRLWLKAQRLSTESQDALPIVALAASLSAALVHAFFSAVFLAPASMMVGFLVLSLCWAWGDSVTKAEGGGGDGAPRALVKLAVLLIFVFLVKWQLLVLEHYTAVRQEIEQGERTIIGVNSPRFWRNSHIPLGIKAEVAN